MSKSELQYTDVMELKLTGLATSGSEEGGEETSLVGLVAVCCSVLQCVAVCCSVFQCVSECCRVLQCVVALRKAGRKQASLA